MSGANLVLIVLALLAVLTLWKGIKQVPQGEVWTVERFGAFTRLLHPGLNFIVPYIDAIGHKMNVQEVVLDIPEQDVITRDNATVKVDGIVYYRVMDPAKAAYQVQDLQVALTQLAMTNIRAVIGEMDLDQTLSSRDRINSSLLAILDGATDPWGVKVSRVEIRKIEPPENLIRAMNLQMTAERERRATVARAEGEREAEIKRAEGQKQALILAAEGRREAAFRDAEARERLAEAEANATRMVAEVATGTGTDALRYFISDKYVRAFEQLAQNQAQKLVIVPMESTALAGGIAQALELLRGTGGDGGAPPPGGGPRRPPSRPGGGSATASPPPAPASSPPPPGPATSQPVATPLSAPGSPWGRA
ncbi:SPFH domain-containing protein [Caldovatus aquaticus]|uniref:Protein QmcA n=1 Tax=Caldovatus aquaticus TaxID=2865671 RepID=A0ABS7EY79_9PROT|nr:SPFH domain-containing protein [Caldovatus aquaticus]MBW8268063.1 SPFH/Band 7/PHB domain protein [Caldovatus aquaticus]